VHLEQRLAAQQADVAPGFREPHLGAGEETRDDIRIVVS
jgi:hypothetical protein